MGTRPILRDDSDPTGHPLSLLSLGDLGAALGLGWVSVMAAKLLADAPR